MKEQGISSKNKNHGIDVHPILPAVVDLAADLLSWRQPKNSVTAIAVALLALYCALRYGYSFCSLSAYIILIRLISVATRDVLCYTENDDDSEADEPSSSMFGGWQKIEGMEDVTLTLRTVIALWCVALVGRFLSDAQLICFVSLAMFVISYVFWNDKERGAAVEAAKAESEAANHRPAWSRVKENVVGRRASLDEVLTATLALHEVTKTHLLKIPSAKLSTVAIIGFCIVYAVVFNPVDVFVLLYIAILNLRLLTAKERGDLMSKSYSGAKEAYGYVSETAEWVRHELAVKEKESEEEQKEKQEGGVIEES